MTKKQKIVYIYPTYNEKENIKNVISGTLKLTKLLTKYELHILVVDDNSPDGTAKIVEKIQKEHSKLILISGDRKGLGNAMIRGIRFAVDSIKADIIILNEADMSYSSPTSIKMINLIEQGVDVVVATRVLKNNNWTLDRKIIHWISNTLFAKFIAGVTEVEDHNCAFRAIRVKKVIDKIDFSKFPQGFSFFNYLIYRLTKITNKIVELPVTFRPRTKGESKISFNPKHILNLFSNFYEYGVVCFRIRLDRTKK